MSFRKFVLLPFCCDPLPLTLGCRTIAVFFDCWFLVFGALFPEFKSQELDEMMAYAFQSVYHLLCDRTLTISITGSIFLHAKCQSTSRMQIARAHTRRNQANFYLKMNQYARASKESVLTLQHQHVFSASSSNYTSNLKNAQLTAQTRAVTLHGLGVALIEQSSSLEDKSTTGEENASFEIRLCLHYV